ncbi:MFS transporter [Janibacter cremeus]|uniref:MFS family permease n=1 Tax=Janibacter cremeus TaxID=1285192 RepID=A0A852VUA5_9MICO|nr:MFS family permease [Janibacter cremeus]
MSALPRDVRADEIGRGLPGFWRALPREGRFLLSTVALQHLGRGMTLPFTVIYLHEVRHLSLDTAGTVMAVLALVAAVMSGPMGSLTDAIGARWMLIIAGVAQSLGALVMAFATSAAVAFAAAALMGLSAGIGWAAGNTFISALVRGPLRQRYFGVNFALLNLGIGAGGLLAGMFVEVSRPVTFEAIYLVDAVLILIPGIWLLGPLRHVTARSAHPAEDAAPASYLTVLRLPGMRWILLIGLITSFVGYGQLEAGIPAFARGVSQVSTEAIGVAFAVNTAVIVLLQFWVLQRIEGHRRTRVGLVMLGIWLLAWLALGASGLLPGTLTAAVLVVAFLGLFGLGETLLQPTLPVMANDLAPDHLRGRVNAIQSAAFMSGGVIGPVVAGVLLERGLATLFLAAIVAGLLLVAWLMLRLEHLISPEVNGIAPTTERQPVSPSAAP